MDAVGGQEDNQTTIANLLACFIYRAIPYEESEGDAAFFFNEQFVSQYAAQIAARLLTGETRASLSTICTLKRVAIFQIRFCALGLCFAHVLFPKPVPLSGGMLYFRPRHSCRSKYQDHAL
ncbi:hypothetical protein [Mesorhizobium sp.]|uniref:hypothetical protein n=1 Tax=Mesorhizobium sp. TaxID=1871066 RepID=UPI000FE55A0B|nr:hypothetical protein [Mesorhizobium sp.]RWM41058.1 MAG: hypothetical protein EOR75_05925 [Mesorhizobium sp.]TIO73778.1 MAG: hypothetical protein E5X75_26870 [Mesorhizobium sp.]TIO82933.1 MAG: hypothetical protein E5X74_22425 [Mesorhizobium sp.]TJV48708.1 MAG: hypothetical protein E5Y01_27040 [Mesorhizobium sp.]